MRENTAASVQEFMCQWQRSAQVTQPTEVERAMAAWRQERLTHGRHQWREAIARGLVALATRIAPTVTTGAVATAP